MPGFVIKELPEDLHHHLRELAKENRRSMTQEAIILLEEAIGRRQAKTELPPPIRGKFPLTAKFLDEAKREGRP